MSLSERLITCRVWKIVYGNHIDKDNNRVKFRSSNISLHGPSFSLVKCII